MLYHKLWLHFIGIHLINFLLSLAIVCIALDSRLLQGLAQISVMLAVGFLGNRWLINKWVAKGYEVKEVVHALSKEQALIKFGQANRQAAGRYLEQELRLEGPEELCKRSQ